MMSEFPWQNMLWATMVHQQKRASFFCFGGMEPVEVGLPTFSTGLRQTIAGEMKKKAAAAAAAGGCCVYLGVTNRSNVLFYKLDFYVWIGLSMCYIPGGFQF